MLSSTVALSSAAVSPCSFPAVRPNVDGTYRQYCRRKPLQIEPSQGCSTSTFGFVTGDRGVTQSSRVTQSSTCTAHVLPGCSGSRYESQSQECLIYPAQRLRGGGLVARLCLPPPSCHKVFLPQTDCRREVPGIRMGEGLSRSIPHKVTVHLDHGCMPAA